MTWREDPAAVRPMLASTADAPLDSPDLAYEPKYDGIRAIASIDHDGVRFWSRLGNDKTRQFPEIAAALRNWARGLDRPVLVDGEIVALDAKGNPIGFQNLQGRIHLKTPELAARKGTASAELPLAYIAFDILRDGDEDLRGLPLRERRARLERLFAGARTPNKDRHPAGPVDSVVRISEHVIGDGRALHARAAASGWEGLVAKRLAAPYHSGRRTPDWRKVKLVRHQTCVIGGWTDPRGTRPFFGALLLGVYDSAGRLEYVGHSGAGFRDAELGRVWKKLHAIQSKTCPFDRQPRTNEKPHWVKPQLVAEVKFTEWTADGKLRHPTYLGLRDDVDPREVRKEPDVVSRVLVEDRSEAAERARAPKAPKTADLVEQLDAIQRSGGDGVLMLPDGDRLEVSNLGKIFWPKLKLTKGDLFRHYARVSTYILPAIADRPLVMKRFPNGIDAKPFYQHRAPDKMPPGIIVKEVQTDSETRAHLIGGSLKTLLYTTQLAAISQDPWFSRIQNLDAADHVAFDLDPPEGAPFRRVLDVARWVRDELDALKAPAFAKTSGAGGLHVYVPMPSATPYEAGLLFCQIVATMVARKHPKVATVERGVRARGTRIYVDYLQNIRGKTLASAYSARANEFAGVSTPVTWDEIDEGVSPKDFTIRNFGDRIAAADDLWAALRKAKGTDLRAVMKYAKR